MNDYSSRSHTILTVHITSEQAMSDTGVYISKQGKINFVDLAGSEMTKKTLSEGKTLEEANNINKSLMVLGEFSKSAIFFFVNGSAKNLLVALFEKKVIFYFLTFAMLLYSIFIDLFLE